MCVYALLRSSPGPGHRQHLKGLSPLPISRSGILETLTKTKARNLCFSLGNSVSQSAWDPKPTSCQHALLCSWAPLQGSTTAWQCTQATPLFPLQSTDFPACALSSARPLFSKVICFFFIWGTIISIAIVFKRVFIQCFMWLCDGELRMVTI